MTDTPDIPEPTIESLTEQVRVKDQVIAAYAEAINKMRTILMAQAQENFQRAQEIIEVAEMRVAKAQNAPIAPKKAD